MIAEKRNENREQNIYHREKKAAKIFDCYEGSNYAIISPLFPSSSIRANPIASAITFYEHLIQFYKVADCSTRKTYNLIASSSSIVVI